MSEQGWRDFLAAQGTDDWVVLHGGATAVFVLPSLVAAVKLAEGLTAIAGLEDSDPLITISGKQLTVRLTRDIWHLEQRHAELAQAISDVARSHDAIPDRSRSQEVQLAVAARPDDMDIGFWRAVLGYAEASDDNGIDPLGHGSTVWMQELDAKKDLRHAMHIDVSVAKEQAQQRLAAALAAGGRVVQESEGGGWILADRAGNKVCIASWPDAGWPSS